MEISALSFYTNIPYFTKILQITHKIPFINLTVTCLNICPAVPLEIVDLKIFYKNLLELKTLLLGIHAGCKKQTYKNSQQQ